MIRHILFTLLILISLIPLSGRSQVSSDTVKCYGVKQLQKIADKLVQGQECDTLLKVADLQLANRDSVIKTKDKDIAGYKAESSLKESIISVKEQKIQTIDLQLKSTKRRLVATKAGWLLTTLALSVSTVYFIIH